MDKSTWNLHRGAARPHHRRPAIGPVLQSFAWIAGLTLVFVSWPSANTADWPDISRVDCTEAHTYSSEAPQRSTWMHATSTAQ